MHSFVSARSMCVRVLVCLAAYRWRVYACCVVPGTNRRCCRFRKALRIRLFAIKTFFNKLPTALRKCGVGQGGQLQLKDFVPIIMEPWRAICEPKLHLKTLETCGYRPFTMKPAFEAKAAEQKKAAHVSFALPQWTGEQASFRLC